MIDGVNCFGPMVGQPIMIGACGKDSSLPSSARKHKENGGGMGVNLQSPPEAHSSPMA